MGLMKINGVVRQVAERPVRHGKTRRDHESGSWKQRFANRQARADWQQDNRSSNDTFPGRSKK